MPKVSVVVAAYNAMIYLPETVESVLRQTFTDFELLIIDDGSSDNIAEWVAQIIDPRVQLITQENQGTAAARNNGIAQARGEYVAFLDADDLWKPTKLEKQVQCMEANLAVGLVHTWAELVDEKGKYIGRLVASYEEGEVWKQMVECNRVCCGSSPLIRRGCFETVGVFDRNLSIAEDWDLWIRIAACYPFAVVKEPLVLYRQHPNNKSRDDQRLLQDYRIILERTFESAPWELLYLRNHGYGHANLYLAWKALDNRSYEKAIHFRQQALAHYSQLRYSWSCIRLQLFITALHWLGPQGFSMAKQLGYNLRRFSRA